MAELLNPYSGIGGSDGILGGSNEMPNGHTRNDLPNYLDVFDSLVARVKESHSLISYPVWSEIVRNLYTDMYMGGPIVFLRPEVAEIREADWSIKAFYATTRVLRDELGEGHHILDIGSTVEVEEEDKPDLIRVIEEAHQESLAKGDYWNYPSSWGLADLRRSIADLYQRKTGMMIDPNSETMVTGGIIRAVDAFFQTILCDYVLIPSMAPYYARSLAQLRGKKVIVIPQDSQSGEFDIVILKDKLHQVEGKGIMYITLPSSPVGAIPDAKHMEDEFIPLLLKHKIPVISDSYIFATAYSSQPVRSLMSYRGGKEAGVEAITLAKELGLPGIRVGGAVGNPEYINGMRLLASGAMEMIPLPNQRLAARVLDQINPDKVAQRLASQLHQEILPRFAQLHWPVLVPQAGLDMLVAVPEGYMKRWISRSGRSGSYQISAYVKNEPSLYCAMALLLQYGVALCPAGVFGQEGNKWMRIVLKQAGGKISKALDRMQEMGFDWQTAEPPEGIVDKINLLLEHLDITKL